MNELIGLVGAVDGIRQMQAQADADYFAEMAGVPFDATQHQAIRATTLAAYRWQYTGPGASLGRS